jgi:anti-sigma B factor antagonist
VANEPMTSVAELRIARHLVGDRAEIWLSGELDTFTRERLDGLVQRLPGDVRSLVLDLTHLSFMDSGGISEVLILREQCLERGGTLTLRNVPANVRRILEVTGLDSLLG